MKIEEFRILCIQNKLYANIVDAEQMLHVRQFPNVGAEHIGIQTARIVE